MPSINEFTYLERQRRKARGFDEAAEAAKRALYPELFFGSIPPSMVICRVCEGDGYHKEGCKLINPDGKDKAYVEDLLAATSETEIQRRSLIELEKERLKKLEIDVKTNEILKSKEK